MLLALDVGNTHTVVGFFADGKLRHQWRISTHPLCTPDELKLKLKMILSFSEIELDQLRSIVVSSVVPSFTRVIQAAFPSQILSIIQHTWKYSFEICLDSPQQVGIDRLVNAEAAVRDYGAPCIVVDSGTATTLCAVSKQINGPPQYRGGAIFAGIELSMQSLAKHAAQLFTIELTPPTRAIGQNTQDALKSGMIFGYASMIDGMIRRFKSELIEFHTGKGNSDLQVDLPVICTGGISHLMKGLLTECTEFDSDLTLKGISYLYESFRHR